MISWPADLPRCMVLGRTGGIGDARIGKDMDAGSKMRRRLSYVPQPISGSIRMTTAQRQVFEAFVNGPLGGGVRPFLFPAQGEGGSWVVQIGQSMPSWSQTSPGKWEVKLDLLRLPQ